MSWSFAGALEKEKPRAEGGIGIAIKFGR